MTRSRPSIWRSAAVVLAAYLLVAQAVLTGLSSGAVASRHDAFGQSICTTTNATGPEAPSQTPHLANCCGLGCAMFGAGVAPPPDVWALSRAHDTLRTAADAGQSTRIRPALERTPQNSRAPPGTA